MNKDLFDSMNRQMSPSPEAREALFEKLNQPVKKRPAPWKRYGALAACAALVIGGFSVYSMHQNPEAWVLLTRNFRHNAEVQPLHSYVTMDGPIGYVQENAIPTETGGGDAGLEPLPNRDNAPSGALPGGSYIGDAPSQEEAVNAYEKLMDRFNGQYPDWYGGAYIDDSGWLVVQLVEDKDPADKSLELQVLDWTDDGHIMFSSCKYSLRYLRDLQDKVCDAMIELSLFSSCGTDEERNRLDLTLTSVTDEALSLLAKLDSDDDAIYVQVGQRASTGIAAGESSVIPEGEDPVSYDIMPSGATVPDDEDLIAVEPYYDGSNYNVDNLPEELPQHKLPAFGVDSAPEEDTPSNPEQLVRDTSSFTPAYDPDTGFISPKE